jgi:hypothetical protein
VRSLRDQELPIDYLFLILSVTVSGEGVGVAFCFLGHQEWSSKHPRKPTQNHCAAIDGINLQTSRE